MKYSTFLLGAFASVAFVKAMDAYPSDYYEWEECEEEPESSGPMSSYIIPPSSTPIVVPGSSAPVTIPIVPVTSGTPVISGTPVTPVSSGTPVVPPVSTPCPSGEEHHSHASHPHHSHHHHHSEKETTTTTTAFTTEHGHHHHSHHHHSGEETTTTTTYETEHGHHHHSHHHHHYPSGKETTTTTTSYETEKGHHHHHHHHEHPYPVVTETIIIIVETFTRHCPHPTTISEGTVTVTVTAPTTITFSEGPYTRTKYHLSCYTTTTEYFYEEECGCGGWPYATGEGYIPITYPAGSYPTPTFTAPGYGYPGGKGPEGTSYPKPPVVVVPGKAGTEAGVPAGSYSTAAGIPAGSPAGKPASTSTGLPVFKSGASQLQVGALAIIAGVVAIMVL